MKKLIALVGVLALSGCAHQIVITPDLSKIDRKDVVPIEKNVGYYISSADREKKVTTPGGGGDKVTYFPYKELEPMIQKILYNQFKDVKRLASANDAKELADNNISYVFLPTIKTNSSSSSALTWPPTDFTVTLTCVAMDQSGNKVWEQEFKENGQAPFSEFKKNFSLSAQRASQAVAAKMQKEINTQAAFRK
jgi:hypothetical protein